MLLVLVEFLVISIVSPVRLDSSTSISPETIIPSAGILSPDCSKTISLTTISSINVSVILLFLFTLQFIFEDDSCNLSNADSLPYSEMADISEATSMAMTIPIVSNQSKSWNRNLYYGIS